MTQMLQNWIPPYEVVAHNGQPLSPNLAFFMPPPLEIGPIRSAYSNLAAGEDPESITKQLGCAAIGGVIGGVIAFFIANSQTGASVAGSAVWAVLTFLGIGFLSFLVSKPEKSCSYVGDQGVAKLTYNKDPQKRKISLFLFQNALELRTSQTRHYTNGVYSRTEYNYTWTGPAGAVIYTIAGSHSSQPGTPPIGDAYHFATAAESAWNGFAYSRAMQDLSRNGTVRFNLRGGNSITLGQGFIEFNIGGKTSQCRTDEIARVTIHQGTVTLRRTDAKSGFLGFGSTGTFSFQYQDVANGRLFVALFERMVGVDLG